jgi:hypothetical protein
MSSLLGTDDIYGGRSVSRYFASSFGATEAYCTPRPEKFWARHAVASRRRKIGWKGIVASGGIW